MTRQVLNSIPPADNLPVATGKINANFTELYDDVADLASETIPVSRIGTGTKDSTTFYRGDGVFATPSALGAGSGTGLYSATRMGVLNNGTDTTTALQAAIDAVFAAGGGTIVLEPGTYLTSTLTLKSNVSFWGPGGRGVTKLLLRPNTNTSIINEGGLNTETANNTFVGITFDGQRANSTVPSGTAGAALLRLYRATRLSIVDCDFINSRSYGVGLQGRPSESTGPEQDIYMQNVRFINNGYESNGASTSSDGLDIKSCRRVTMVHCYASGNTDKGFNIRGRFVTLVGCRANANVIGFDLNAANAASGDAEYSYFDLHGCVGESNSSHGIAFTQTENQRTHAMVNGCYGRNNGGHGILAKDQTILAVSGGGYFDNTVDGIRVEAIHQVCINGAQFRNNNSDGIEFVNQSVGGVVSGCTIMWNSGFGVRSTGTSTALSVVANHLSTNTAGSTSLTGTNSVTGNV